MTSPKKAFYKPELDALRFTAFGMVFIYHFLPESLLSGRPALRMIHNTFEEGVQVFFLLSAFLITTLLLKEREKTGTVRVKAFYIRRVLRIWPLYFFLIFSAAAATIFYPSTGFSGRALLYFALLSGNWYVVLHGWVESVIAPLWTISLEEQFYLIWPMTMRRFATRGLFILAVLFAVAAYVSLWMLNRHHASEYAVRANSFVQFQFFSLGALIAILLHKRQYAPSSQARIGFVFLFVAASWCSVRYGGVVGDHAASAVRLLFGYGMVALAVSAMFFAYLNAAMPPVLKPLIYLGRISYGLYAFHFLAFAATASITHHLFAGHLGMVPTFIHGLLAIVMCLLLAVLSYHFLEMPFLRLKSRFTFVSSRDDTHGIPEDIANSSST